MTIHLQSACRLAKTFSVKREKLDDESEQVIAHLKIGELLIDRDQLDEVLKQPIGWSSEALFDEFGAPRAHLTLSLGGKYTFAFTGVIDGGKKSTDPELKLKEAAIDGIALELTKLGAPLSCQLSWVAAGDEVDDIADMLGLTCNVVGVIEDGGQADLLRPLQALQRMADRDGTTMTMSSGGETLLKIEPRRGDTISSAGEAMKLLQKGWVLVTEDPDGDTRLESPDGKVRRHIWLNAANSCIKRGLVCNGDNVNGFRYTAEVRA